MWPREGDLPWPGADPDATGVDGARFVTAVYARVHRPIAPMIKQPRMPEATARELLILRTMADGLPIATTVIREHTGLSACATHVALRRLHKRADVAKGPRIETARGGWAFTWRLIGEDE